MMLKLINKKKIIAAVSILLVTAIAVAAVLITANNLTTSGHEASNLEGTAAIQDIRFPGFAASREAGTNGNIGGSPNDSATGSSEPKQGESKKPFAQGQQKGGTKAPPGSDSAVSVGTVSGSKQNPDKSSANPSGDVVGMESVPRGEEPAGASGKTPKASEWVSVNANIPQTLYGYDYTVINQTDLLTGKQLEYRGFRDWDKASSAATGGLNQLYTIDYRKITSTAPNDKEKYLKDLVYWTGESAHLDICDYMCSAINNKIISTASVISDGSLMYNNGVQLIRARVFVTWQSGAGFYGLQNGVKYYKDVEVAVYAATGEDRYGFGTVNNQMDMGISLIPPNSDYRAGTEVITSYRVNNYSNRGLIPSDSVAVQFYAYYYGADSSLIYLVGMTKSTAIPVYDSNIVYFKWQIPEAAAGKTVYISSYIMSYLIDANSSNNYSSTSRLIYPVDNSRTPDTIYEAKIPAGWASPSMPSPYSESAVWNEWNYINGTFIKTTYGIRISAVAQIIPDSFLSTVQIPGQPLSMKSGYGFTLQLAPGSVSEAGAVYPNTGAYTSVQRGCAYLPEFLFSQVYGKYRSLHIVSGVFQFEPNLAANGSRLHFIPIWYPDGYYVVTCMVFDFWTPIGMISARVNMPSLLISGWAYDDYIIERK